MAGHSKWANIKHKKAKEDAKKGKVFTKLIKEITVVARDGGGDPAANPRLRLLMEKAKQANMPSDNVTRAIKKGTGEIEGVIYESHLYEGHGPGGIAVMIETLSDNKNRTVADVRSVFTKSGGQMGSSGAVAWMFEHRGVVTITGENLTEDDLLEKLIDFDVEDIEVHENTARLLGDKSAVMRIKEGAESSGFTVESADLEWVASNPVELSDEAAEKAMKFLDKLDDLDDVQNVYANIA